MTHTKLPGLSLTRRRFLAGSAALGGSMMLPGLMNAAWAAGSDAPEKKEIRVGFIPLTDCASVVMAAVKQFDQKYGIKIIPSKEASWAAVRDKLLSGELDAAHVLYGMVYGLQLGVAGPQQDMAVLMTLNNNGQAITLSNQLKQAGVTDAASLKKTVDASAKGDKKADSIDDTIDEMWRDMRWSVARIQDKARCIVGQI